MKKSYLVFFILFLGLFFIPIYLKAQTETTIDSYSIALSGSALNSTNGLNITVTISGGTAQLASGATLKASGATQLLSDVNTTTNVISVVWSGAITNGEATISGKLAQGSVSSSPILNISKIEAAGGKDITSEVLAVVTTSGPLPTPTPELTPTPTPQPTPEATPTPAPTPSITIKGPDTVDVSERRGRKFKLSVTGVNFEPKLTRCTASTSERSILRVTPTSFVVRPRSTQAKMFFKGTLTARVRPMFIFGLLNGEEFEEEVDVVVNCRSQATGSKTILITTSETLE